jgi:uncharacterized membrane protein YhhN
MLAGWIVTLAVAITDWVAVIKGWKKVEYLAKPATMLALFLCLLPGFLATGFKSIPLLCFGGGILLSLLGDVSLMVSYARFSNRWFMLGLVSFLLAHVAYIIGLNIPLADTSPLVTIGIAIILALTASRILRRIVEGVRLKKLRRMVAPVVAYGLVITLMLLSALLTFYNSNWNAGPAGLVALGASLFYFSDILLAWNRYVNPIKNGRAINMAAYHLGQMAMAAGVLLQFGK